MKTYSNQPINPPSIAVDRYCRDHFPMELGLTIRQHYAGLAMAALITAEVNMDCKTVGEWAVKHADALIAALNNGE